MLRDARHALVAFGANLPFSGQPPQVTLRQAAFEVERRIGPVTMSRLFATPCFPAGAGPDYVNAAARVSLPKDMAAEQVLAALHRIEADFGRRRDTRWGMRTLDLDLLALDDLLHPDAATWTAWAGLAPDDQARRTPEGLILPHPRLQDRAFVLVPLADVAPDWRHPVNNRTVLQMRDALPVADLDQVRPL